MLVVVAATPGAALAQSQTPTPAPPVTLDGPSSTIVGLSGMSIARDGTGGLVYLKYVGGVQHVFVSRLVGGVFQAPEEIDAGFAGPSSQPVIAAGSGGMLVVAFINSGGLYVVDRANTFSGYSPPLFLADGASNPAVQMSAFGKAYLAFAQVAGVGSNVRAAYYYNGQWALVSAPLNAVPSDNAGTGTGRPEVATAGDGIATVVWGEESHVFTRRVWYTSPSIVSEQADPSSVSGWSEVSASQPYAAAGGTSSYVDVVFDEQLASGASQQSRVLLNRLRGSSFDGVVGADGLGTPGGDQATDPRVAMAEYGNGVTTSYLESSDQVYSSVLGANGYWDGVARVDSLPNASPPYPVPAVVGVNTLVVGWQHDSGLLAPDIRARYFTVATGYGPELSLSAPGQAANAAEGLADGGDVNGDVGVAWLQGSGAGSEIEVAQLYQAPEAPQPLHPVSYTRNNRPTLSWSVPTNSWGPFIYTVIVSGVPVGTTTSTSLRVPSALSQGPHNWSVVARNPAGQQSSPGAARIWIDSQRPSVHVRLTGGGKPRAPLTVDVRYIDRPVGRASGVTSIIIRWGDGSNSTIAVGGHTAVHVYRRAGTYVLKVIVTDRAGNRTTIVRRVKIGTGISVRKGPNVRARSRPPPATRRRGRGVRRPLRHGAG